MSEVILLDTHILLWWINHDKVLIKMRIDRITQFIRFVRLSLLLFFIVSLVYVSVLNVTGYCWGQSRYISYEEKIKAVYGRVPKESFTIGSPWVDVVPYTSFEEFMKENPDCCEVNYVGAGEIGNPGLFRSLMGNRYERIKVKYKDFYKVNGRRYFEYHFTDTAVTSCGKIARF
jgi:hypothetical protein